MAAGAVSLELPNFLTTSQDVTKGADQAKYHQHPLPIDRSYKKLKLCETLSTLNFSGTYNTYMLSEDKV